MLDITLDLQDYPRPFGSMLNSCYWLLNNYQGARRVKIHPTQ